MHVFIVYCHPSQDSTTYQLKEAFIRGLKEAHHTFEVSDLYANHFDPVYTKAEYRRDAYYDESLPIKDDILKEQAKVQRADAIAFVYPVFWSECPALLTGWFQRVWTCGFAYGTSDMKVLAKVLCLVSMGGDKKDPIHQMQMDAMRCVMLEDRINTRSRFREMYFFDKTSREDKYAENREENIQTHLHKAYQLGKDIENLA